MRLASRYSAPFDADGAFLAAWGSPAAGNGLFDRPFGIAVGGAGNVYVTDRGNHRIQVFEPVAADAAAVLARLAGRAHRGLLSIGWS